MADTRCLSTRLSSSEVGSAEAKCSRVWRLEGIPWNDIDASAAIPELRALVRQMAYSENATYSATQRFLQTFYEDIAFTQWIAVWFYEETKHPHVLLEWLRRTGEAPGDD